MKDAYYFPHDSNAQHDEKVLQLRARFGWEGYGIYWAIIEKLRESPSYNLKLDSIDGIALGLSLPQATLLGIVNLCFKVGLLSKTDQYFYSESLSRRMNKIDAKREKFREFGRIGGKISSQARATLKPPSSSKVKESKVNESKFIPPSLREVEEYFKENNIPLNAVSFHSHYEASNWFRGKTKIKNWKACVNTWLKNNDSRSGHVQSQVKKPVRISAAEAIAQQS